MSKGRAAMSPHTFSQKFSESFYTIFLPFALSSIAIHIHIEMRDFISRKKKVFRLHTKVY